jgi:hypothetical protein
MTNEENWLSRLWDDVIAKDQMGSATSARIRAVVDNFGDAVRGVSATAPNPKGDLLALVNTYAPQIWGRAVLLVQDTDSLEWSDRILYCARAKMEVALKSHAYVVANPEDGLELVKRFEDLSRNYVNFAFSPAAAPTDPRIPIILTGFDPYDFDATAPTSDITTLAPNPAGQLALYFSASPKQQYPQSGSPLSGKKQYIQTCIFPNRWEDFNGQIVENVIGNAIESASATVKIVCTCSLQPDIKVSIVGGRAKKTSGIWQSSVGIAFWSDVHVRIDRFAGKCRSAMLDLSTDDIHSSILDNNGKPSDNLSDASLPKDSDKKPFYKTNFDVKPTDISLTAYDALPIKIRYCEQFRYTDNSNHVTSPADITTIFQYINEAASFVSPLTTIPRGQAIDDANNFWSANNSRITVKKGSGGAYLSNEIFYRVSNLVQSSTANTKYAAVTNGHIHLPHLGEYKSISSGFRYGEVKLGDLVTSVLAVLDRKLGP